MFVSLEEKYLWLIRGQGSVRLGHKIKRGDTWASTSSRIEKSSPRRSPSPTIPRESLGKGRLPQTHEDDVPITLGVEDIKFVSRLQLGEYITQMPDQAYVSAGRPWALPRVILRLQPSFAYMMGYYFPFQGFIREVFRYYQLGPGQFHPNGWII
jgi:hypothetical protein